MVEVKLEEGIEDILTLHNNSLKQGIEVLREYESLDSIKCFPDKLNQVWSNLIQNAIHAMNYSGILTIKLYSEGNYQVVAISDNGSGIPGNLQEDIFKPMFTTKSQGEGTGLGLDIVKKMIDSHNGKIELKSEEGKGTTFSVYILKEGETNE